MFGIWQYGICEMATTCLLNTAMCTFAKTTYRCQVCLRSVCVDRRWSPCKRPHNSMCFLCEISVARFFFVTTFFPSHSSGFRDGKLEKPETRRDTTATTRNAKRERAQCEKCAHTILVRECNQTSAVIWYVTKTRDFRIPEKTDRQAKNIRRPDQSKLKINLLWTARRVARFECFCRQIHSLGANRL